MVPQTHIGQNTLKDVSGAGPSACLLLQSALHKITQPQRAHMSVFKTDLHLDANEWRRRLRDEGEDGYTDPISLKRLSQIEMPVVIRGDGLTNVVWELNDLLAYFGGQAPDAAGSLRHPFLSDRRFALPDIEAVTGPSIRDNNLLRVAHRISEFFRDNRPATARGAPRPAQRVPTGQRAPSRSLARAAVRRLYDGAYLWPA